MIFFKTEEGFVVVAEYHAKYFRRNFKYTDEFRIVSPNIIYPKNKKKAYGSVSKEDMEECLNQTLKEYKFQINNVKKLMKRFNLKNDKC